jgi:predicted GNAT family acetyltransferase
MHYLSWLSSMADLSGDRVAGFVWEEDGEIIGNLSLVPFTENGRKIHLIANVAVRPEHRRRGIGRALTTRALEILRRKHEPRVWLQVRAQDEGAQALYRSVGFVDRFRRTTWRIKPVKLRSAGKNAGMSVSVRKRLDADWGLQRGWLISAYPPQMRWNLPVNFHHFAAGPMQEVKNFFEGVNLRHWTIEKAGECQAVLTWQKTTTYANNLWLAFRPDFEPAALQDALPEILSNLRRRHPLSLDLAEGLFSQELDSLGFNVFRTLIWMSKDLS